jgi:hypothetical protein
LADAGANVMSVASATRIGSPWRGSRRVDRMDLSLSFDQLGRHPAPDGEGSQSRPIATRGPERLPVTGGTDRA